MTKQEKIKESYGEHWDSLKEHVNERGWLNSRTWLGDCGNTKVYHILKGLHLDCMDSYHRDYCYIFRPKSLSGIENNNGWNRIEDGVFPEDEETVLWLNNENYEFENASLLHCDFNFKDYTHWRPLPKDAPLY